VFVRSALGLVLLVSLVACSNPKGEARRAQQAPSNEPIKRYDLHGEVLRLDAQGKIAAIKHEQIGDWMGAMTMEFPVKDAHEFEALRVGETIRATVFVQGLSFWVAEIHETPDGSQTK
jgi:Cu/Ag efflux protein CusF